MYINRWMCPIEKNINLDFLIEVWFLFILQEVSSGKNKTYNHDPPQLAAIVSHKYNSLCLLQNLVRFEQFIYNSTK